MKIVIPEEKFPMMDKLISKIKYDRAKPLIDFLNSCVVEEKPVDPASESK